MSHEPEKVPSSIQISRQLDQEKITFLTKRIEDLLRSNNELRSGASQNEKDTHDIVLYFQREMEIKDDIILRLNEELVKCQTQLKFEVERIKKQYEAELQELKHNSEHTISNLQTKLTALESDLKSVEMYKREKDLHEEAIRKLEKNMQQQREQLIDAMEEQERRFLEEKAQIFKELDEQKAAFREVALNEARLAMSEEAKKILADNNRMFEELKFHHAESVHFQAEKAAMVLELATAKRELSLLADKELEYARQGHNRTKEIKALRERVEVLEKQQATNIEKFKTRAKEIKASVTKELEEATLDAAGLRRLLHIKNKELKHMKSLAATILAQREETEQFFLEALQEVKEVIRAERKKEQQHLQQQQLTTLTNSKRPVNVTNGTTFPPLNIKPANLHLMEPRRTKPSELKLSNLDKVTISDLNWEDKELVLRILFAKMNGASGKPPKRSAIGPNPYRNQQEAVFISEGVNLPDQGYDNLGYFEVANPDDISSPKSMQSFRSFDEQPYENEQYQQYQETISETIRFNDRIIDTPDGESNNL